jgi:undecaprenyl diphosphate synthase
MRDNFAEIIKPDSADAKLLAAIDLARLPRHIAVIMDGNGRWAKKLGKPRIFGHKAGAESVKAIIDTCARLEIGAVTLYAFSTENWKRPKSEVSGLMSMLKRVLRRELDEVSAHNIKFQAIGNIRGARTRCSSRARVRNREDRHEHGNGDVCGANYGGRAEIADAARRRRLKLSKPAVRSIN